MQQHPALEVLIQRVSCAQLEAPAPDPEQLILIQKAALRAADHHQLRPWRFLVIEGEALKTLGKLFLQARLEDTPDLSPELQQRAQSLPLRAPMIVVAIANPVADPKVPELEQLLSAGAAVQNMLNAAFALGVGAIWRTGDLASDPHVCRGLGLADSESIIGFLYLGAPKGVLREAPALNCEDFFKTWP